MGTICVTRDDTQHPYVLYNKPSVTIQHVHSANCPVADVSIDRSIALPGTWDVTFIPYCGGHHTCEVIVDQPSTGILVKSFDVIGVPPLDSMMMRGPSWSYNRVSHNYGANETEVGIVTKHHTNEQRLSIQWPDGKSFRYRWGTLFDVQLYH